MRRSPATTPATVRALRAATVEAVDYATPRGLRKDQILELTQNRWLRGHESLLITGGLPWATAVATQNSR